MKKIIAGIIAAPFFVSLLVAGQVSLTVLPYAPDYEDDGSYYVGLTQGYLNGDSAVPFWMYCVDFNGTIYPPTTYNVTMVSLNPSLFTGDSLGLSLAQLQTQYLLGQEFGSSPSGNSTQDSDIQHDIWNFTGGAFTPDANMTSLLSAAEAAQASDPQSVFSNAYLFDVTGPNGQQAFMPSQVFTLQDTAAPLPEPRTFSLLVAAGLLAFVARRRVSITVR